MLILIYYDATNKLKYILGDKFLTLIKHKGH